MIHPYLIGRCRASGHFSLQCAWLLQAYSVDANLRGKRKAHGTRLRTLILSGELAPRPCQAQQETDWRTSFQGHKVGRQQCYNTTGLPYLTVSYITQFLAAVA